LNGDLRLGGPMETERIVPWTCHICKEETDLPFGHFCARCTKMTCERHFKRVKMAAQAGKKAKTEYVCMKCES